MRKGLSYRAFIDEERRQATPREAWRRELARSERFELPTLGIEIRCSIQLSYERVPGSITRLGRGGPAALRPAMGFLMQRTAVPMIGWISSNFLTLAVIPATRIPG